jgi:hypothetical protein
MILDIGKMVGDSFEYAQEGLVGKWTKWFLLVVCCVIFPLFVGYRMRIFRGANPSPEPYDWGTMFIDGIKLIIVGIMYALPVIILAIAIIGSAGLAFLMGAARQSLTPGAVLGLIGGVIAGVLVLLVLAFIIWLIATIAFVRFARTGSFGEAFNIRAILATIGRIGWISYIFALIVMVIIIGILRFVCMIIPVIGILLLLFLLPFIGMFSARYITLLYDSAGEA